MKSTKGILVIIIVFLAIAGGLYFWSGAGRMFRLEPPQDTNLKMLSTGGGLPVEQEEVNYFKNVNGFLARPQAEGVYPGVVMIHEWWGLNDNIKAMASELAKEGYIVLAVDLHNGRIARDPDEAKELVGKINSEEAVANMRAAVNYLRRNKAGKIASLGWCFGGGKSLELALSGEILDATALYYGQPVTDKEKLKNIKWPVLGIFGDRDASIPAKAVNDFSVVLEQAGVESEIYLYPGVGHAFANPSGAGYAPEQTKDAWQKTLAFLEKHLRQ